MSLFQCVLLIHNLLMKKNPLCLKDKIIKGNEFIQFIKTNERKPLVTLKALGGSFFYFVISVHSYKK